MGRIMTKGSKKEARTVNKQNLASLWNKDPRQIGRFLDEGMPSERGGRGGRELVFDVAEVTEWRIRREVEKKHGEHEAHKQRSAKLSADKLEIEVKRLKGEIILVDEMEDHLYPIFHNFRARMLALPATLAHVVTRKKEVHEIEVTLTQAIHEALEELAQYDREKLITSNDARRPRRNG